MEDKFYKRILKGDHIIWVVFFTLCCISMIEVFSASSALTYETGDHLSPIKNHCVMLMVGIAIAIAVHHIPVRFFKLIPFVTLPLSVILLAVVMGMGLFLDMRVNGSSRWLFGFQPSEMAKMAIVTWTAFLLSRYNKDGDCSPAAFKPILISAGIVLILIAPENLSTALLVAFVIYLMMIIGCIPWRQMFKLTSVIVITGAVMGTALLTVPPKVYKDVPGLHRAATWRARIIDYINPEYIPPAKFDIDGDAQKAHSHIAISSGGMTGKGPGNSTQRDFLSHGYSDFIYAITVEELGLGGGLFVVFLYIVLLFRAGKIAKHCNKPFPAFLITGVTLLMVCQAFLHMAVSVGLFPITGQPLPLVSKGGSSIMFNSIYIGIMLSVSRYVSEGCQVNETEGNILPALPTDNKDDGSDGKDAK